MELGDSFGTKQSVTLEHGGTIVPDFNSVGLKMARNTVEIYCSGDSWHFRATRGNMTLNCIPKFRY